MNDAKQIETIEATIIEGGEGMIFVGAVVYDSTNDKTYMVHTIYSGTYTCRAGGNSVIVELVRTSEGWDDDFPESEYFDCKVQIL